MYFLLYCLISSKCTAVVEFIQFLLYKKKFKENLYGIVRETCPRNGDGMEGNEKIYFLSKHLSLIMQLQLALCTE